jgi:hypothetical protein
MTLRLRRSPEQSDRVSREAKEKLEKLLLVIRRCCKPMEGSQTNGVELMLYFDEAHVLSDRKIPDDPDGKDMYDVLCSCFNAFLPKPIFVIYLSTTSNISQLSPAGPAARSSRARAIVDALQAPITEVPFDCSPAFPIKSGCLSLQDVCEVKFMAQFGRPM